MKLLEKFYLRYNYSINQTFIINSLNIQLNYMYKCNNIFL